MTSHRLCATVLLLSALLGANISNAFAHAPLKPAHKPASISMVGHFLKTLQRVPAPPDEWRKLTDMYDRFSIALPNDWVEGQLPDGGNGVVYSLCIGEGTARNNFHANLIVSMTQVPKTFHVTPALLPSLAQGMKKLMIGRHLRYVLEDEAFTHIASFPCAILGGTWTTSDGHILRNLQLRVAIDGFNYVMTFTALNHYYLEYEPLFARLIKSISFGPSASPNAGPSASPNASPSASPNASPSASPNAGPSASPNASPSASPNASPSASPNASPSASPNASPSASPNASPNASPDTTPSESPAPSAEPPRASPSPVPNE